jgi:transcription antitermination factor NusG
MSAKWYALVVRSNRAFQVRDKLQELGIDEFLPTFTEQIRWSDRIKSTERQLFPGYLFAKLNGDSSFVLNLPGVIQLLPSNLKPTSIDDAEIESLRIVTASQLPAVRVPYTPGTRVSVISGPLAGACGIVEKSSGAVRVILGIEMLGRAVSVMVDAEDLEKEA